MADFMVKDGKNTSGHSMSIKRVTKDKVYLINPWSPDKVLTMNRSDFLRFAKNVNIVKEKPNSWWENLLGYIGLD